MNFEQLEKKAEKKFYITAVKKISDTLTKSLEAVKKFVDKPHVSVDNLDNIKVTVDKVELPGDINIKNFPDYPTEMTVKNFPEPVREVTVKNMPDPVTEVTIKNPVEAVEVKNMPQPELGIKEKVKQVTEAIVALPKAIQEVIRQTTQGVRVENTVDVKLIDPETGKPYKASGGGSVAMGGSSYARSHKADTSKITVGATSTSVVASNRARIQVVLVNDSNETIYLGYEEAAVLNEGIRLNANGGSIIEERFTGAINAISTSGSKNLTVVDVVL